ncbi:hypothetical protein pEaSNUABM34_00043 [Erwinia phage pEa_SNUABM_34]|nr:hypothetical protein pEaSNUABM34_00043 [Erwinia phage pEa_SNUABM_34]QYW05399.1 hypothetical protein pEaSNUABM25_00043 [Erwinia phage pEa_SNUABM_25]
MLQYLSDPHFMTRLLCAVILIIVAYLIWQKLKIRRAESMNNYRASLAVRAGDFNFGRCWRHRSSGRDYVILWMTNLTANKQGWEVMVTYTNNHRDLYTRPVSQFYAKFRRMPDSDSVKDLSLSELLTLATANCKMRVPLAGETWVRETSLNLNGTEGSSITEATITDVLALDTSRPVVTYTVNGKHTAMLMYVFLADFKLKEVQREQQPKVTA